MKKSKEELALQLLTMPKDQVIQLFLMLTLEHKKALKVLTEVGRHHQGNQSVPGNLIRDYLKTSQS